MVFKTPEDTQLITWTIIGLLSAWGGVVRYIMAMDWRFFSNHRFRFYWRFRRFIEL
jgi:hypothetical protein